MGYSSFSQKEAGADGKHRRILSDKTEIDLEFSAWAEQCCRFARQQEEAGDYEAARRIMSHSGRMLARVHASQDWLKTARADSALRSGACPGGLAARTVSKAHRNRQRSDGESLAVLKQQGLTDKTAEKRVWL